MKIENLVLEEGNLEEVIKRLEPYPFIEVSNGEHMKSYSFEYIEGMTYGFIWQLYDTEHGIDYELLKEALTIHADSVLSKHIGFAVTITESEREILIQSIKGSEFVKIIGTYEEKDGWDS